MSMKLSLKFFHEGLSWLKPRALQLQHLMLQAELRALEQIDPAFEMICSLTHLNHLDVDLTLVDLTTLLPSSYFHVLRLPHLRVLRTYVALTSQTLRELSQNMAQLEVLTGDQTSTIDLVSWCYFKQLRSISFYQPPQLSDEANAPAADIGNQLASMSEIGFHYWCPNEVEFWQELIENGGSNLTSLHFISYPFGVTPFPAILSACTNASTLSTAGVRDFLLVQLKSLRIDIRLDTMQLLDQVRSFTGLTSLTIMKSLVTSSDMFRLIYLHFNDSSFLPQLLHCECTFLRIHGQSMWIHYDMKNNLNQVYFPHQTTGENRLTRDDAVKLTPPATRLVGIELNPGPAGTSSSSSSPMASSLSLASLSSLSSNTVAQHLFNDGLTLIFSFLTDEHWFKAARTSQHWISVAHGSTRTVQLHLTANTINAAVEAATRTKKSGWRLLFSCASNVAASDSLVSSRWNLLSHLTSLRFDNVLLSSLSSFLHAVRSDTQFTSLTSFSIAHLQFGDRLPAHYQLDQFGDVYVIDHELVYRNNNASSTCCSTFCNRFGTPPAIYSLHLPPSLTSFEITNYSSLYDESGVAKINDLIHAIGECRQLTCAILPLMRDISHTFSLNPLSQLTQLTHLRLYSRNHYFLTTYESFVSLGKIKSLTDLDIVVASNFLPDHLRHLQLPLIRRFKINFQLSNEMLTCLQYNMPLLVELDSYQVQEAKDLTIWSKFIHLRSMIITKRPHLTGRLNPPDSELGQAIGVMAAASLTELQFYHYSPEDSGFWQQICNTPLSIVSSSCHLTSLEFISCQIDPLTVLIQSDNRHFLDQLQALKLEKCIAHEQVLQTQLLQLPSLTSINISDSFPSSISIRMMYTAFDDPTYLPLLTRIYIRGKESFLGGKRIDFIVIEYEEEKGANQVKFQRQTEEEKVIHRGKKLRSFVSDAAEPPAPRLVGIELNPGPSSPPALTLFRDGLALIFSYLDGSDWLCGVRSCREWITIAASSRQKLTIRLHKPLIVEKPKPTFLQRFFQTKLKENPAIVSSWRLPSHIGDLKVDQSSFHSFCAFMQMHRSAMPGVTRLHVTLVRMRNDQDLAKCEFPHFPPSLTFLTLITFSIAFHPDTMIIVDALLAALIQCPLLTHIALCRMSVSSSQIFVRHGFSSLASLTQLQYLVLCIEFSTLQQVTSCIDIINTLTHLTHLDLDFTVKPSIDPISCSHFNVLQLRNLRHLHPHTVITSETLHHLGTHHPQLEELISRNGSSADLNEWTRFSQLRQLCIHGRPRLGIEVNPPTSSIGRQLAAMSNLTEIQFDRWCPNEVDFWHEFTRNVGPHLTSLHFCASVPGDFDPFASLVSACDNGTTEETAAAQHFLHVQLKSLRTEAPREGMGIQLLDQLARFTGLTSLRILYAMIDPPTHDRLIYNRFNSRTFLPALRSCHCVFRSCHGVFFRAISIQYNCVNNENKVSFERQREEEKRLDREASIEVVKENEQSDMVTPLAPRLVGIELNPGPPQEIKLATTLFNDGIRMIQSFLSNQDWLNSALVSHHWFSVASRTLPSQCHIALTKKKDPIPRPLIKEIGTFFRRVFSSNEQQSPPPSPPSFVHLVTSLDLQQENMKTKQLRQYCHQFPSLTSLTVKARNQLSSTFDFYDPNEIIPLPLSLRFISIDIADQPRSGWPIQSVINSIARVVQLESLQMKIVNFANPPSPIDPSPLTQLQQLHTLRMSPPFQWIRDNRFIIFMQTVTLMSTHSLRHLTIDVDQFSIPPTALAWLKYDGLKTLTLSSIDGELLVQIGRTLPTLESIESVFVFLGYGVSTALKADSSSSSQLSPPPLFPLLQSIGSIDYYEAIDCDTICRLFSPAHLTELGFTRIPISNPAEWNRIAENYPLLHTIRLRQFSHGLLFAAMQVMEKASALVRQSGALYTDIPSIDWTILESLHSLETFETTVNFCKQDNAQAALLKSLRKCHATLTSLTFTRMSDQALSVEENMERFQFPQLRRFSGGWQTPAELTLALSRTSPLLEMLEGAPLLIETIDLATSSSSSSSSSSSALPLFPHLRSFEYRSTRHEIENLLRFNDGVSEARESHVLCNIAGRDSLTYVTISRGEINMNVLFVHYPNLTRLTLTQFTTSFPFTISSLITSLIVRRQLRFLHFQQVTLEPFQLMNLNYLKALIELRVEDSSQVKFGLDFDRYSQEAVKICDSVQFLPRLRRLRWTYCDQLDIEWDTDNRINRVHHQILIAKEAKLLLRDQKEGDFKFIQIQLTNRVFIDQRQPVAITEATAATVAATPTPTTAILTPPASRLVGIELNPGPPTSASSFVVSVSPTSITLFRDGLELIFSFLDGSDWLSGVRSCREWITIAASSRKKLSLHLSKLPKSDESSPKQTFFQRVFGRTTQKEVAVISPWQLASHVDEINISQVSWSSFCSFMQMRKSSLIYMKKLTILALQTDGRGVTPQDPLSFPPSLISFSLEDLPLLGSRLITVRWVDAILNALCGCPQLTHLELPLVPIFPAETFRKNGFTCLKSLAQLRHLRLHAQLSTPEQLFQSVKIVNTLTELRYLDLNLFCEGVFVPPSQFHELRLPCLRQLHMSVPLPSSTLTVFATQMPQLEVVRTRSNPEPPDLSVWNQFKQLKQFTIYQQPLVDGEANPSPTAIGRQLARMSNLTELTFTHWCPTAEEFPFWHEFAAHVGPNLTSLQFVGISAGDHPLASLLSAFTRPDSPASAVHFFQVQLKSLQLQSRGNAIPFLPQLRHFVGLTSLPHLHLTVTINEQFHEIYNVFNDPTFLPNLVSCQCIFFFEWKKIRSMSIHYNQVTKENRVFFEQQTEEEKQLHREESDRAL